VEDTSQDDLSSSYISEDATSSLRDNDEEISDVQSSDAQSSDAFSEESSVDGTDDEDEDEEAQGQATPTLSGDEQDESSTADSADSPDEQYDDQDAHRKAAATHSSCAPTPSTAQAHGDGSDTDARWLRDPKSPLDVLSRVAVREMVEFTEGCGLYFLFRCPQSSRGKAPVRPKLTLDTTERVWIKTALFVCPIFSDGGLLALQHMRLKRTLCLKES
jgi:hypothetical protein